MNRLARRCSQYERRHRRPCTCNSRCQAMSWSAPRTRPLRLLPTSWRLVADSLVRRRCGVAREESFSPASATFAVPSAPTLRKVAYRSSLRAARLRDRTSDRRCRRGDPHSRNGFEWIGNLAAWRRVPVAAFALPWLADAVVVYLEFKEAASVRKNLQRSPYVKRARAAEQHGGDQSACAWERISFLNSARVRRRNPVSLPL
jgi:hypothetical protein